MSRPALKRSIGVACVAVSVAVVGMGLYGTPPTLDECIDQAVSQDLGSERVSRSLSLLGQRLETAQGTDAAKLTQSDFKRCLGLAGRWSAAAAPQPPTPGQTARLSLAPSFEYGRYSVKIAQQAPELSELQRDLSARLFAQAGPVAESMRQAYACSGTPASVSDSLRKYGTAYVAATGAALGVWEGEGAMDAARELLMALGNEVEVPACESPRAAIQAKQLDRFAAGEIEGLPCTVKFEGDTAELRCGSAD